MESHGLKGKVVYPTTEEQWPVISYLHCLQFVHRGVHTPHCATPWPTPKTTPQKGGYKRAGLEWVGSSGSCLRWRRFFGGTRGVD